MFGSSGSPPKDEVDMSSTPTITESPSSTAVSSPPDALSALKSLDDSAASEKGSQAQSQTQRRSMGTDGTSDKVEKKRRSSGVGGKASSLLASAKDKLNFSQSPNSAGFMQKQDQHGSQTPLQKLGKQDPALAVPQGQHNNSAGESKAGLRSTFKVGVWEDRNKKCRRTMEDTHAFLYNFLYTPAPDTGLDSGKTASDDPNSHTSSSEPSSASQQMMETDNGYFAIFDGHAGTFAADWCGKKLHIILEDIIKKNPNTPIPELLDLTFTTVDSQLEKLPVKNSGCTAVTAVLRWEDRIANPSSATGSTAMAPATIAAIKAANSEDRPAGDATNVDNGVDGVKNPSQQPNAAAAVAATPHLSSTDAQAKIKTNSQRHRVLYTANVGDARIVLCRGGKALRLSYDHKGSDEGEGKRIQNAGGLILNNRVNGVLAVTRALGDSYMKDLVTGHPYTTETVIQPDLDEFIILACDGLWDVCSDQEAVDLVRQVQDPVAAAKQLVEYALSRFSTDNLSCMIVRLNKALVAGTAKEAAAAIGVEGDKLSSVGKLSETEKLVGDAKRKAEAEGVTPVGVSGSNSGKGHDSKLGRDGAMDSDTALATEDDAKQSGMEKVIEEPVFLEGDGDELAAGPVPAGLPDPIEIRNNLTLPPGAQK